MSRRLLYVDVWPKMFVLHRMGLAKAAQDAGYEIHVAAPDGPGREAITEAGFRFHAIPLDRRSINPWRELRCTTALIRLFQVVRPDLIHAMA
jgi:UDP:flavonoid glycosyltransferase YjiC (YdhE family)